MTQPPQISEDDRASLRRYLLSFEWEMQNVEHGAAVVDGGLPLWQQILRFTPNPTSRGRALELGSPPFHITLLMQKLRNYDLELTGFATVGSAEIAHTRRSREFAETYEFRCRCFDAERDRFPYDDGSFDLVIWSEVIEHLTLNPVHTLSEIHRVLKPGGSVIVSTPNATRADNIANLLYGLNIYDPYHLGSPFAGSRHSREYTFEELRELVAGCGFEIERMEDIDIYPPAGRRVAIFRTFVQRIVRLWTRKHYRYHLFVRAKKTERPFRWHFPAGLYEANHLALYLQPRDASVVMGENDEIHLAMGWGVLHDGPDRRASRRAKPGGGDAYLKVPPGTKQVRVLLSDGAGKLYAMHDNSGDDLVLLGVADFTAPAGRWSEVVLPVNADFDATKRLHVRFDTPTGVEVHSIATE